ncbi:BON domain-containing protein [Pseudomonas sp. DC3000-4b1]|uniref:BON domain-containing protein n=1 Tax=unclassified Pseudomonas TaxID=196821 RepID=UPI003CF3B642
MTQNRLAARAPLVSALASLLMLCSATSAWADTRQDAWNEGAASTAISLNSRLANDKIQVKVSDGRLSLTGEVEGEEDKALAERLAQAVARGTSVDNRLVVSPALGERPPVKSPRLIELDDLTLATTLEARLHWSVDTASSAIHVKVEGSVVTLTGQAATAEAKTWAGSLAEHTTGVIVVNNLVSLRAADTSTTMAEKQAAVTEAGISDAWIGSKLASSYQYERGLDALRIDIKVSEGIVRLSGEVDSQAEEDRAADLARHLRGVRGVDTDLLKVAMTTSR